MLGGVWLLAGNAPAHAQSDIFTVRAVPVDETAETAAAARQAAISAGQQLAFDRLLARLVPLDQIAQVPVLGPGLLEFYVLDFSVANERTSPVRYLADMTFRFNAGEVRTLLRNSGVGFAETRSKPLLVLPVFTGEGDVPRLWLDPNPWRVAWSQRLADDGLVPLQVPLGDLRDVASIDASRAQAGDFAGLSAIGEAYGAGEVLVSEASLSGDTLAGSARLAIVSNRYEMGQLRTTQRDEVVQAVEEAEADFFARAAQSVDSSIQEAWKQQNLLQFSNQRSIAVFVPLGGLSDWIEVRRRIDGVASIQAIGVTSLSRRVAEMEITFVGDEQRLTRALAQRDLFLSLREDSNWELTLAGRGPAVPTDRPAPPLQ
ncbi:DUF2066 domain-containing protein [Pelagibius sp.]|uniref:DUF2066 domain-containing protein n=1 Tax=Pelagibius sp. TaxID=1931238 RepID=UPI00261A6B34|nr:DUF2066 domain-containing protein [Pelagibius sp.]